MDAVQLVDPVQNVHALLPPFQPSWLSITFSLPFSTNLPGGLIVSGEAKQKTLAAPIPACPASTHPPPPSAHMPCVNNNPHLTTATSPARTPGIPVILPRLLRDLRDHVTHRPGAFPPPVNSDEGGGGWGWGGPHPCSSTVYHHSAISTSPSLVGRARPPVVGPHYL